MTPSQVGVPGEVRTLVVTSATIAFQCHAFDSDSRGDRLMSTTPLYPSDNEYDFHDRPQRQSGDQVSDFRHPRQANRFEVQAARAAGLLSFPFLSAD
jgi:hypothetical protein